MKSLGEFWKFWGTVVVSLETGEQSWSLGRRLASTLGILDRDYLPGGGVPEGSLSI